jgi:hypothetical protein
MKKLSKEKNECHEHVWNGMGFQKKKYQGQRIIDVKEL